MLHLTHFKQYSSSGRIPSGQMQKSLVFNLVNNGYADEDGGELDSNMLKEVYWTEYGKGRIYKIMGVDSESKKWVADPKNRVCDVEGGWYCRGQYPPEWAVWHSITRR